MLLKSGVGRQQSKKLKNLGIHTVLDLAQADYHRIGIIFSSYAKNCDGITGNFLY